MTQHLKHHSKHSENLIKLLGIESLPAEQKAKILDQVSEVVEQRLFLRLMDALPADKAEEFKNFVEAGDGENIQSFIEKEVPNFIEWVQEETNRVKDELNGLDDIK